MSDEVAVRGAVGPLNIPIKTLEDVERVAKLFAASGFFRDAKDMAKAAVKIMAGSELGIPAFASMNGINLIQDKLAMGAGLIAAKIKGSGKYDYVVKRLDDTGCTLEFSERGKALGVSSFTKDDAAKAGLLRGGGGYEKFPRNMYFARAMSNGARWYCPDVFGGPVYTPDELGVPVNEETGEALPAALATPPVIEAPVQPTQAAPQPPAQAPASPPPTPVPAVPSNGSLADWPVMKAIALISQIGQGRFSPQTCREWFGESVANKTALEVMSKTKPEDYLESCRRLEKAVKAVIP